MAENVTLTYKGHPLVRHGNDIYYGAPEDPYGVYMQILGSEEKNGIDTANRVQVMLLSNAEGLNLMERIVRVSEKNSLYSALDIGSIWYEKALLESKK